MQAVSFTIQNLKVFADKQTDSRQTNRQAKNYMPRSIDAGAYKTLQEGDKI